MLRRLRAGRATRRLLRRRRWFCDKNEEQDLAERDARMRAEYQARKKQEEEQKRKEFQARTLEHLKAI